jgi:hypothetical protein
MQNSAKKIVSVLTLAIAIQACGERKSQSSESTSSTNDDVMMVSGTLSLETELTGYQVSLFKISEVKDTELLLGPIATEADGTYVFNVDLVGENAVQPGQILITMGSIKESEKSNVIWSYLKANSAAETSNLNVLASIAYEVGVLDNDLSKVFEANDRTADAFGLTEDARKLELLSPKNEMLQRLGKIVNLVAKDTPANIGQVHQAIAKDILDGALDGKEGSANVSFLTEELYTAMLLELKAVISGTEPNLDAIKLKIPVE